MCTLKSRHVLMSQLDAVLNIIIAKYRLINLMWPNETISRFITRRACFVCSTQSDESNKSNIPYLLIFWTDVLDYMLVGYSVTHRRVRQVWGTRRSAILQQGQPQSLRVLTPCFSWSSDVFSLALSVVFCGDKRAVGLVLWSALGLAGCRALSAPLLCKRKGFSSPGAVESQQC